MINKRKTQIPVPGAEVAQDKMPKDFALAVKDIKLAILQARAKAARLANAEALKLYFFVGGYISKKTRNAKWGSGAIDALSNQLQVELPGQRGFSATSMKKMRLFFEAWSSYVIIRPLPTDELDIDDIVAFCSIGFSQHVEIFTAAKNLDERLYYIHACAKNFWPVTELRRHLEAHDYRHIGALPNNSEKTLSPMAFASKAVRSFRDEYLLELVKLLIHCLQP